MGTEKWYVALPDDSGLLARAEVEANFGEYLGFPSIFEKGGIGWKTWDNAGEEFCSVVSKINDEHPGINRRVYTLDRDYDKLHYLLSEERRCDHFDKNDWATQAILGATALSAHLRGGQGHPIRWSPVETVREIASWLKFVSVDDLRSLYDPGAMQEHGVYKNIADDSDGRQWQFICSHFEAWKSFYLEVAECQEGVLVITT